MRSIIATFGQLGRVCDMCAAQERGAGTAVGTPSVGVAFDLAVEAMLLIDGSLRIVRANAAAHRTLASEELVGRAITDFSAPALASRAHGEAPRWLSGELTVLERETEFRSGSGQILTAVMRVDALPSDSGHRFFLAQLRDVTTERQQHQALHAARDQYQQLVDNLPGAVVMLVDTDLMITLAAGEGLAMLGYRPEDVIGRQVRDAVPRSVWQLLEPRFQEMVAGVSGDFEYDSPTGGRQLRMRTRPVRDLGGGVVGGLIVSEDVSEDRARRVQMEQVRELGGVAGAWYDLRSGWSYDQGLLDLWGSVPAGDPGGLPFDLIPPEQAAEVTNAWQLATTTPGRHAIAYRVHPPLTETERHVQSTHQTVLDADGRLLRVISTHVDVTDTVRTRERNERQRAATAEERRVMLRRIVDSMATSPLKAGDLLGRIVDLTASTLAGGAALRVLNAERSAFELDLVAHADDGARGRLAAHLQRTVRRPVPSAGLFAEVVGRGNSVSTLGPAGSGASGGEVGRWFGEDVEHVIVAPVRHGGAVLGALAATRSGPGGQHQIGDDDVLQVLADKAGAVLHELSQSQEHLGLLEQLAGMETRERHLLAESIHDEPIQHLVAGIMRLEMVSQRLEPGVSDELIDIAEELERTADWLRNLIMVALSPPELSAGLGPALSSLAHGIFANTAITVAYEGPHHVPLPIPAKEMAYRIFREALLNVRQHADATAVVLRVDADRVDDQVVLSLIDNGNGVAAGPGGRQGIDTMVARARAEGGTLAVSGTAGLGTTVTLTLPRLTRTAAPVPVTAGPTQATSGPTPDHQPAAREHLSIVICDDRPEIRRAIGLLLANQSGYRLVGEGDDGTEGRHLVQQLHPDVLIMDFSMPGGGPSMVRSVKQDSPSTHVIVFTGREDTQTHDAMREAGADQYVIKTGRLGPLLAALKTVDHTTPIP